MKKTHHGSCHCGAVRFSCTVDLAAGTSRCNCSVCAKQRFWKAIVKAADFELLHGAEALSDYRFASRTIQHRFCRHCGTKPFGKGHLEQLGGDFYAINIACLDDVTPKELAALPVHYEDGRENRWEAAPAVTGYL